MGGLLIVCTKEFVELLGRLIEIVISRPQEHSGITYWERAIIKGQRDNAIGNIIDLAITLALGRAGAYRLLRGIHFAGAVRVRGRSSTALFGNWNVGWNETCRYSLVQCIKPFGLESIFRSLASGVLLRPVCARNQRDPSSK
jgi:hypothetical protein